MYFEIITLTSVVEVEEQNSMPLIFAGDLRALQKVQGDDVQGIGWSSGKNRFI